MARNRDDNAPIGKMQQWLRTLKVETVNSLDELEEEYGRVENVHKPYEPPFATLTISNDGMRSLSGPARAEQWYKDHDMLGLYAAKSTFHHGATVYEGKPFKRVKQGPGYNR